MTTTLPKDARMDLLRRFLPPDTVDLSNPQTELPRIARDRRVVDAIRSALGELETGHRLFRRDARDMSVIQEGCVHLVLTSPPYWTLKEYRDTDGQLGHIADYEAFLGELDRVWQHCFRVLAPGGRLVVVVGDVCLS